MSTVSAAPRPASRTGLGCGGALLILVGIAVLIPLSILPAIRTSAAATWRPVPCTIIYSDVKEHPDSDGSTYSVDIHYQYIFNDRRYTATRYDFSVGSSSGYDSKKQIVNRLPVGLRTVCYVDPNAPASAVLVRSSSTTWIGIAVMSAFVTVGVILLFSARKQTAQPPVPPSTTASLTRRTLSNRPSQPFVPPAQPAATPSTSVELRPTGSPLVAVIVIGIFTLFWDGIVSIFVLTKIFSAQHGAFDACSSLFLLPFVGIGILLIGLFIYQLLALFNPRPHLTLTRQNLALGDTAEIRWQFDGRADRISNLTLTLEAREEATYRRGTTTSTDKNVFFKSTLIDTAKRFDITSGRRPITIPATSIHTLRAPNNRIIWSLELHGQIAGWPDVKASFPIDIAPLPNPSLPIPLPTAPTPPAPTLTDPAAPLTLEILNGPNFTPGSTLNARLTWNLFNKPPTQIDIRLFWFTTGKGTRDLQIVQSHPVTTTPATPRGQHLINLTLPDSPYSFSGKLISLTWSLEAVPTPHSQTAKTDFTLSPTTQEILLP